MTTLGFTGHTPKKLKPYGDYSDRCLQRMTHLICRFVEKEYPECDRFVCGGALGWDMASEYAAIALGIPFTLAIPYEGQEERWSEEQQDHYNSLRDLADDVIVVSEGGYESWKMMARNKVIVDRSDSLCALWSGVEKGGTYNCVQYAIGQGKPVANLWKSWVKYSGYGVG